MSKFINHKNKVEFVFVEIISRIKKKTTNNDNILLFIDEEVIFIKL
jgi:hypothetical protein